MVYDLICKNRTVRKFRQDKAPSQLMLKSFVASAARVASAANLQRLRYFIVTEKSAEQVFPMIKLGGYLPEGQKPTAAQRPTAYIIVLGPRGRSDANLMIDAGIAAEAITLTAAEASVGSCMIRSFSAESVSALVGREDLEPLLVIALGYAAETCRITNVDESGSIRYYINEEGENVVPKYTADELLVGTV